MSHGKLHASITIFTKLSIFYYYVHMTTINMQVNCLVKIHYVKLTSL